MMNCLYPYSFKGHEKFLMNVDCGKKEISFVLQFVLSSNSYCSSLNYINHRMYSQLPTQNNVNIDRLGKIEIAEVNIKKKFEFPLFVI